MAVKYDIIEAVDNGAQFFNADHAGKLQDKVINLGIRELLPFGGRLRARGKIVGVVGK
jgi:hypothetical protein